MTKHHTSPHAADPLEEYLRNLTRRRFFGAMGSTLGAGLGATALASLLDAPTMAAPTTTDETAHLLRNLSHYAPRAKRVIYMHMEGGPSQLDILFDQQARA